MLIPFKHRIVHLALLVGGLFAFAPATYAQVVQTLPFVPVAINNSGAILGYKTMEHPVQWTPIVIQKDGSITPLGPPGISFRPVAWNELGQAVGCCGAVVSTDGTITALDGLSGYGINDNGLIVGLGPRGAASYQNGTMTDLGVLPGFNASVAIDVNNSGDILGSSYGDSIAEDHRQGFFYSGGVMTALPYYNGQPTLPADMNDSGLIVGLIDVNYANDVFGEAFLYDHGTYTDLGNLPGGRFAAAKAINNLGHIVGVALDGNSQRRGFLYRNGVMLDLGNYMREAIDINDSGVILGIDTSGRTVVIPEAIVSEPTEGIRVSGGLFFGDVLVGNSRTAQMTISNLGAAPLTVSSINFPPGYGLSGNWNGGTLPAHASQVVSVTFLPAEPRNYEGFVNVVSDATAGSGTIAFAGYGRIVLNRSISLSGNLAFGNVPVGTSRATTLTISNTGNTSLEVQSITVPTGFYVDWYSGLMAAGTSKNVLVSFLPLNNTSYGGLLTVVSDATTGVSTVPISGTGGVAGPPKITLTGNLSFGTVAVGTSVTAILQIANTGEQPLTVSQVTFPPGFAGDWSGGVIPAGGSHDVTVTFTPTAAQSYDGVLTVLSDASAGANTLPLQGTGSSAPSRILKIAGNLAFGNVPVGSTKTNLLVISNDGNSPLTILGISFSPAGFASGWSGGVIPAGASHDVTVTFAPTAAQSYDGTVTVLSDASNDANTLPLQGVGIPAPTRLLKLGDNLAFGSVPVGSTKTNLLVISNDGNSPLTILGINYPAGFAGDWSGGVVPAGASHVVTVTFAPTAAHSYDGTLTVLSDASNDANALAVQAVGSPAPSRILRLGGNLAFGTVPVGSSKTNLLVISNDGNSPLTILGISFPTGLTGNWTGGKIAAGGTREVAVIFSPVAAATYNGNVTVNSDATGGSGSFAVFAVGVQAPAGTRKLALIGDLAYENVRVGSSKTATLRISNSGNAPLTVISLFVPAGFSGDWPGGIIPAGDAQLVTVTFHPTSAKEFGGNVTVNSNATEGKNTIPISGTGFVFGFLAADLQKPTGEEFHLQIRGEPGKTLVIEASPDLKDWTELARVQSILDQIDFSEVLANSSSAKFYRFYSE